MILNLSRITYFQRVKPSINSSFLILSNKAMDLI